MVRTAPKTAPRTSAEPMRPTMSGLSAKRLVTSGMAMPSEKTERPSISVPPLANSQSQYSRRPMDALSSSE